MPAKFGGDAIALHKFGAAEAFRQMCERVHGGDFATNWLGTTTDPQYRQ
jgi:hypothetical protein